MITTVVNPVSDIPVLEFSGYDADTGFMQLSLDLVRESTELQNMFIEHDFKELCCVDEAEIASLNEASFSEIKDKLLEIVNNFISKIKQIAASVINKLKVLVANWNMVAKKCKKVVNSDSFKEDDSKDIDVTYVADFKEIGSIDNTISKFSKSATSLLDEIASGSFDASEWDDKDEKATRKDLLDGILNGLSGEGNTIEEKLKNSIVRNEVWKKNKANANKLINILENGKNTISIINNMHKVLNTNYNNIRKALSRPLRSSAESDDESAKANKALATLSSNMTTTCSVLTKFFNTLISVHIKGYNETAKSLQSFVGIAKEKKKKEDKIIDKIGGDDKIVDEFALFEEMMEDFDDDDQNETGDVGDTDEESATNFWESSVMEADASFLENESDDDGLSLEESEAQAFWGSSVMESDNYFIEPIKTGIDETTPRIGSEKDNYVNDPEKDKGADDLMEDDDSTAELEMESFLY